MRALLVAAVLWSAAAPSAGNAAEELSYDALLEGAAKAREAGDLEQSLDLMRRAFAIEPTLGLRHNIARLLEELGRYREAIDEYAAVSANAAVDPALKQRDEAAIARLAPKLAHGWLVIAPASGDVFDSASILLDGAPIAVAAGEEMRLAPGRHVIEIAGTREVAVLRIDTPSGVRTTLPLAVALDRARTAEIAIGSAPKEITRVSIDGYSLRTSADRIERVRVPPGLHRVQIELAGRPGMDATTTIAAGATFTASDWATVEPVVEGPSRLGPIVTGVSGAAAAAGGVVLLLLARAGRDKILDAETNELGQITGITHAEADRIESRSALEAGLGVTLVGAGAAAIAGGLIWWLAAGED